VSFISTSSDPPSCSLFNPLSSIQDNLTVYFGCPKMAYSLLDLPHEVLHSVLVNTKPDDLGRLCCCRTLNDFIKHDRLLYKELYLKHFVRYLQ